MDVHLPFNVRKLTSVLSDLKFPHILAGPPPVAYDRPGCHAPRERQYRHGVLHALRGGCRSYWRDEREVGHPSSFLLFVLSLNKILSSPTHALSYILTSPLSRCFVFFILLPPPLPLPILDYSSYYMHAQNMTFQQALAIDVSIEPRNISIESQNAFQWYCYYLSYTSKPWLDCSLPQLFP